MWTWPSREAVDTAPASERPRPIHCVTSRNDSMVQCGRLLPGTSMKIKRRRSPCRRYPKIPERVLPYQANCKGLIWGFCMGFDLRLRNVRFWLEENWRQGEGHQKKERNSKTETTTEIRRKKRESDDDYDLYEQ
uniref:Uncharacterized protein n=1 Tax=Romanomermis culicivorax TaxID=13658 RepID=A0A915KV61_ROMCU